MRLSAILAAAALAGVAGGGARAEDLTATDLRCVVAFTVLVNNPTYHEAAASGIFYFLGRVEGREPQLDLAHSLHDTRRGMQNGDFLTEAQRCGAVLKAKNDSLKAMNSSVSQKRGVG